MKKKLLAILTVAALTLGCTTVAFAAKDETDEDTTAVEWASPDSVKLKGNAKKALTTGWEWVVDEETGEGEWVAKPIWTVANTHISTYEGKNDDFSIKAVKDDPEFRLAVLAHLIAQYPTSKYKVIRLFELKSDSADDDEPVAVTVADLDVKGTKKYGLVRLDGKVGEWSTSFATGITSKDGIVKFQATKTGVVALVEIKGAAPAATTDAKAATGTKTAPKTGEV